jgi:hypothetical protein
VSAELVDVWRRIILGESKSWALFRHGTCVILTDPAGDLASRAVEILGEFGPVHVGSPAGDFSVVELADHLGWVVTGHHPDVLNFVSLQEVPGPDDLRVGLLGRSKRDRDGRELEVVHVEDRRPPAI